MDKKAQIVEWKSYFRIVRCEIPILLVPGSKIIILSSGITIRLAEPPYCASIDHMVYWGGGADEEVDTQGGFDSEYRGDTVVAQNVWWRRRVTLHVCLAPRELQTGCKRGII